MSEKSPVDRLINWLFGVSGFVISSVFLVGGVLLEKLTEQHVLASISKEFGVATLMAVILGFTLDRRQKQELNLHAKNIITDFNDKAGGMVKNFEECGNQIISDLKQNSFKALFNWIVPESFLCEVEDQIFKAGLIRKRCRLDYGLRELTKAEVDFIKKEHKGWDETNRIVLETTFSFRMYNHRPIEKMHIFNFFTEKEDAPAFNRYTFIRMSQNGKSTKYSEEQMNVFLEADDNDNCYKLPEISIPANGHVDVEMKVRCLRDKRHTREVFTSLMLTEDLKVVVKNSIKGLDIRGEAMSPHEMSRHESGDEITFEISRPLLPFQGIMVWWHNPNIPYSCKTN